jgi:hypothetical protein
MTPGRGDEPDLTEPYNCERDCKARGRWRDDRRAARGCVRPDLPPVRHRLTLLGLYEPGSSPYMGRPSTGEPVVELGHNFGVEHPPEPAAEGCPGAWYRTETALSIEPYLRPRIGSADAPGGWVPRPLYDQAPWQVQAAVHIFERERDRCLAHWADERERRARAAREVKAAQQTMTGRPRQTTARPRRG